MQGQTLPPETIQALRTARAGGATIRALNAQYGVTNRTIHRYTFGLSPRTHKVYALRTPQRIISLLLEFGSLSVREMTGKMAQDSSCIYKKLKELQEIDVVERFRLREGDCRGRLPDFYRLTRAELGGL